MNFTGGHVKNPEIIALTDDWGLWPEFAVRSTGFPVEGLDAFGPDERESLPRYVDFDSPALRRTLTRFAAAAREQLPDAPIEFTEMLPGPEECWLESAAGRHTSELRIVAFDRSTNDPSRTPWS